MRRCLNCRPLTSCFSLLLNHMEKPYQKQRIQEALEANGWSLISKENRSDWWINELWTLESTWSPKGLRLFVTFIFVEDEFLWDASASFEGVSDCGDKDSIARFDLANKWESTLDQTIKEISKARDSMVV